MATASESTGIIGLWSAWLATYLDLLERAMQLGLLVISIIGGLLYIRVMWHKLQTRKDED